MDTGSVLCRCFAAFSCKRMWMPDTPPADTDITQRKNCGILRLLGWKALKNYTELSTVMENAQVPIEVWPAEILRTDNGCIEVGNFGERVHICSAEKVENEARSPIPAGRY